MDNPWNLRVKTSIFAGNLPKIQKFLGKWNFFFAERIFFPIFFRKFVFYAYRVYNLAKNIRVTLVLTKYKLKFFLSILVPITTYISPQNLRFFEICGMPTVPCPNHYITITLIFATWFLRYSWQTQCPQKSGVWCIVNMTLNPIFWKMPP